MNDDAPRWRSRVVWTIASIVVSLAAAWSTTAIFDDDYRVLPLFVAVVAASMTALAVSSLGWWLRVLIAAPASLVGGATIAVVWLDAPIGPALREAPISGIGEILEATWPSPTTAAGVAAVVALAALSAMATADLALHRRSSVALLPTLTILGLSALLSAPGGPPDVGPLAAYATAAMILMLSFRRAGRDLFMWAGAVVTVAVLIPTLISATWSSARYDPRELDADQQQVIQAIAPLGRLDEWRSIEPAVSMFHTDSATAARWRVVALNRFDGVSWLPADDYRRVGAHRSSSTDSQAIRVTIDALDTPWLPMLDRTVGVDTDHEIDGTGGSLLSDSLLSSGTSYVVDVVPVEVQVAELGGIDATAASLPWDPEDDTYSEIRELASLVTAGAVDDLDRAQRLASFLQTEFVLDPSAPPGHSLGLVDLFLSTTKRGSDEQFVAAYGLLAASIGLPVRVAVGFLTAPDAAGGTSAMSDAAQAWPEVEFRGVGWVPFDPIPTSIGTNEEENGTGAVAPIQDDAIPPPTTSPSVTETTVPNESEATEELPESGGGPSREVVWSIGIGGLLVLLGVAYAGAILVVKRRRRHRRRSVADPAEATLGAFASGMDLSVDLGAVVATSATPLELVDAAGVVNHGAERLLTPVARQATATLFDPRPTTTSSAEQTWATLESYERATLVSVGRRRWWRARLSRRSLGRERRW